MCEIGRQSVDWGAGAVLRVSPSSPRHELADSVRPVSTVELLVNVLGPVVALVAIGAFAGPRLKIHSGSLSALAYWVLGPAFVFDLFRTSALEGGEIIRLVAAGAVGMVAAGTASFAASRSLGNSRSVAAASMLSSTYGNVGNAGLAITVFAIGDDALAAAGVLMLSINATGIALGVGLAAGQTLGPLGALRRALLAPMTLAAALAVVMNVVDVGLPVVAARSVTLMSGALIPVMLITLGVQLMGTGLTRPDATLGSVAVSKLLIAPAAAVGAALLLGLEGDLVSTVAIQSAMPPAVFTMVVAMEHHLEAERVTHSLVATTLASLITLPIVLTLTA